MAQVNVIGRITADLELKTSEKSNPYVRFDIAENIGSRQTLHTQYFQVCAWGEDANRLMKAHAKKGSLIWVTGSLELEPYTKRDGISMHDIAKRERMTFRQINQALERCYPTVISVLWG